MAATKSGQGGTHDKKNCQGCCHRRIVEKSFRLVILSCAILGLGRQIVWFIQEKQSTQDAHNSGVLDDAQQRFVQSTLYSRSETTAGTTTTNEHQISTTITNPDGVRRNNAPLNECDTPECHNTIISSRSVPTDPTVPNNEQMKFLWEFSKAWGSTEHLASIRQAAQKAQRPKQTSVVYYYTNLTRVVVAHRPRYDLLGSFVRPTMSLLAITRYYGWELQILPFRGSSGESLLKHHLALGDAIDARWGTGYQDVSNRHDFDPIDMNVRAYDILNFFPKVSERATDQNWIKRERIPEDGVELQQVCRNRTTSSSASTCFIQISDDYDMVEEFIDTHGGLDVFFPLDFRMTIREKFLSLNKGRLQRLNYNTSVYNVVVHVRRGDINHPQRWVAQQVYFKIVRNICLSQPDRTVHVHIVSSGKTIDGNWATLEALSDVCSEVTFHLDENEFDSWTRMVAANVLVMAPSSFSLIPALLNTDEVYFPRYYLGSLSGLSSWKVFDSQSGELIEN